MSKIASYLATHLRGEVLSSKNIRNALATDGSVLKITPILAVYPYDTSDVRKIAHFAWQLAQKGHVFPLTTRGSGASRVGAAIGSGAIISLPTHFDTIFEVDTKQKLARVQPGVTVASLQQTMRTHGLEWPVDVSNPASTIGGAIANNSYGEKAVKFGDTSEWVDQIEIVLSNGDTLQTGRLSKRQLSKKKGLSSSEGEIYRKLDALIEDNEAIIAGLAEKNTTAGYAIAKVKDRRGNFDLTPLIAGSQGTLGIVTEAILKLGVYHPQKEVIAVTLSTLDNIDQLISSIQKYSPDKVEYVDGPSVEQIAADLKDILPDDDPDFKPKGLIFIELSDIGRKAKGKASKLAKAIEKLGHQTAISDGDTDSAGEIWQTYSRIQSAISQEGDDHKSPVSIVEDALLPISEVVHFIEAAHELAKKHRTKLLFSAHLGTGVVNAHALLDMQNLTDRNKVTKLIEDYYELVIKHDGGIAGEYAEGRLRASQNSLQFTENELELFAKVKSVFDIHGIFNPGVKLASEKDIAKLNEDFEPGKFADNLPRL
ncbi:MAG: FAD-binding oxidoreductase [Candidatus Saccharibacteria bacterium]|nr:FAD-binding oxidoreductase [Candidatus Saccharibacteria bacterium]